MNFVNNGIVQCELAKTGGHGLFTSQINELAYDAIENKEQGLKEIYVFEEWGFFTGFSYLTENSVPYTTVFSEEQCDQYLLDGNNVVVCSWSEDGIQKAKQRFENQELANSAVAVRYCLDGEIAFYTLTLSPKTN